jgi:hypothetical protein
MNKSPDIGQGASSLHIVPTTLTIRQRWIITDVAVPKLDRKAIQLGRYD